MDNDTPCAPDPGELDYRVQENIDVWDRIAGEYDSQHGKSLTGPTELRWGVWRIPDSDVGVLGDVT